MTIETKFDIGQEVWFMAYNKPNKGSIVKIDIDIAKSGDWYIEHYKVKSDKDEICRVGQSLFPTKEELLKNL